MSLSPRGNNSEAWIRHFDRMASTASHQNSGVYFLKKEAAAVPPPTSQSTDLSSVTTVEPAQQVVQQAKADLIREEAAEDVRVTGVKYSAAPPLRNPPSKRLKSMPIIVEADALQGI